VLDGRFKSLGGFESMMKRKSRRKETMGEEKERRNRTD
jgi:hypothetical protein